MTLLSGMPSWAWRLSMGGHTLPHLGPWRSTGDPSPRALLLWLPAPALSSRPFQGWSRCATIHPTPSGRLRSVPSDWWYWGADPSAANWPRPLHFWIVEVTLVTKKGLLGREDADAVALIETALRMDGVRVLTQTDAVRCEMRSRGAAFDRASQGGAEKALPFDAMFCAVGRTAHTEGFRP